MKKVLLITILFLCLHAQSQTVAEWTQQKKMQIKYLVTQIAALQSYAAVTANGYAIAQEGLTGIRQIKKEDLAEHENYYASLKGINPVVTSYWKTAAAIALQVQMVEQCKTLRARVANSDVYNPSQKRYCSTVIRNVLLQNTALVKLLTAATTRGAFQMTDDQRLRLVDKVYADMQDLDVFLRHYMATVAFVGKQQQLADLDSKIRSALGKPF